jgi:hypothetical protein
MDSGAGAPLAGQKPPRSPVATAVAAAVLAIATVLTGLVFTGRISLGPPSPGGEGMVFYLVPYHYGFAFYDRDLVERERIEVKSGAKITLVIVPAQALPEAVFREYAERSLRLSIGGLPAGDPRISAKIMEDLALGNVEHIIGIAAHPVYLTTNVSAVLGGQRFRRDGPRSLAEAVKQKDPAIKSVTFTAKRVGSFDVLCVDSGMEGAGTCGWGHKWMVAKGALVVRPE